MDRTLKELVSRRLQETGVGYVANDPSKMWLLPSGERTLEADAIPVPPTKEEIKINHGRFHCRVRVVDIPKLPSFEIKGKPWNRFSSGLHLTGDLITSAYMNQQGVLKTDVDLGVVEVKQ